MSTTTYSVTAVREGRWWEIQVPEVGGHTQARRLSDIELLARELIAVTLDVPLSAVAVDVTITKVGSVENVSERAAAIRDARRQIVELERWQLAEATQLAHELTDAAVPLRDIGTILDVSFQRVHQLTA
ncbi:MAG: HicB family toxin-antitoxin system [Nakamurella sp.]